MVPAARITFIIILALTVVIKTINKLSVSKTNTLNSHHHAFLIEDTSNSSAIALQFHPALPGSGPYRNASMGNQYRCIKSGFLNNENRTKELPSSLQGRGLFDFATIIKSKLGVLFVGDSACTQHYAINLLSFKYITYIIRRLFIDNAAAFRRLWWKLRYQTRWQCNKLNLRKGIDELFCRVQGNSKKTWQFLSKFVEEDTQLTGGWLIFGQNKIRTNLCLKQRRVQEVGFCCTMKFCCAHYINSLVGWRLEWHSTQHDYW